MSPRGEAVLLSVGGREVRISNPGKVYFPAEAITKLELVHYYLAVGEGVLRAIRHRPVVLKRYVDGIEGEGFFQKRAPSRRPDWIHTVTLRFPSGRTANELVVTELAQLVWMTNLGNIDLNVHPVRADDLEHPDELRIDLDPTPGVAWDAVREVALLVREVLAEHNLVGWPKTSGSRGLHIYARIERGWGFDDVRRAALALARDVERRAPSLATSKWWKEERTGVFLDYNQNAKDRTMAAAYSVRPTPDARVSAPLDWDELPTCELGDFTLKTMPERFTTRGDPAAGMDATPGSLDGLLEVSRRQAAEGLGDAPWPPHYRRRHDEPARVQPSRATGSRRRRPRLPLITVAKAKRKDDAVSGLDRWRSRHPEAAAHLVEADVLVDTMRGRFSTWTRIRLNLQHVPEALRPADEAPDPDYDPWRRSTPES